MNLSSFGNDNPGDDGSLEGAAENKPFVPSSAFSSTLSGPPVASSPFGGAPQRPTVSNPFSSAAVASTPFAAALKGSTTVATSTAFKPSSVFAFGAAPPPIAEKPVTPLPTEGPSGDLVGIDSSSVPLTASRKFGSGAAPTIGLFPSPNKRPEAAANRAVPFAPPHVNISTSQFDPLGAARGGRGGRAGGRGAAAAPQPQRREAQVTSAGTAAAQPCVNSPLATSFQVLMTQIFEVNHDRREELVEMILQKSFFDQRWDRVFSDGDSRPTTTEIVESLLLIGRKAKPSHATCTIERWAYAFLLGCNLNYLECGITSGAIEAWQSALSVALERANMLTELWRQMFEDNTNSRGEAVDRILPQSATRVIMRRVRTIFDMAFHVGYHERVQCELKGRLPKLRGRFDFTPLTQPPPTIMARSVAITTCDFIAHCCHLHQCRSELHANFIKFATSFHEHCVDEVSTRCNLYYHIGHALLEERLQDHYLKEVRGYFATALCLLPTEHPDKRLFAVSLLAVMLALGAFPEDKYFDEFDVPEGFRDVATAVKTGNLTLYDEAVCRNLPLFTELSLASLILHVRPYVLSNMIVNFQEAKVSEGVTPTVEVLDLEGLQNHYGNDSPYATTEDIKMRWIHPLLRSKFINGALGDRHLVLSKVNSFKSIEPLQ